MHLGNTGSVPNFYFLIYGLLCILDILERSAQSEFFVQINLLLATTTYY